MVEECGGCGFSGKRPDGRQEAIAFNGSVAVPPGKPGRCVFGPVARAAFAGNTIVVGYTGVGGWSLVTGAPGYTTLYSYGAVDLNKKVAYAGVVPDLTAFFKTPESGLPGAGGIGGELQPGFAQCERYFFSQTIGVGLLGGLTPPLFRTVWNHTPNAVAGDLIIQAKRISGQWFVDVEPC